MKLKWCYDACGEYADYRGFIIINQDHPSLIKYQICKEAKSDGELSVYGYCNTQKEAIETIDDLTTMK